MENPNMNTGDSRENPILPAVSPLLRAAEGKAPWSAPSLIRLSGKDTEGKIWYSPVEFMNWSAPS
jgi:hypothetical protein